MMTTRDRRILLILRNAINAALDPGPALAPALALTALTNEERVFDLIYAAPQGLTRSEVCRKAHWLGSGERDRIINKLMLADRLTMTIHQSRNLGRPTTIYTANSTQTQTQGNHDHVDRTA